ncbi:MAG: DUF1080 domain-containing protein [Bacteroidales bacterium]|nr:DUF1080 domain-containing protein [Bacteroidales bacterium]
MNRQKDKNTNTSEIQQTTGALLSADNTLSDKEISEGWQLLFDGKTNTGWMNAKSGKFPSDGWKIENGALIIDPEGKSKTGGGDIVTVKKFGNFELSLEFKYTPGANSGIKYFVDIEKDNGDLASIGCEYQILDDRLNEDAKAGVAGNHTLAALYDLIPPQDVSDNGPGQWNKASIIVNDNKVQHLLNGIKTVEYERGTPEWRSLVAKSKYRNFEGFGEYHEGRILLQDHGHEVEFRNIKIREIK